MDSGGDTTFFLIVIGMILGVAVWFRGKPKEPELPWSCTTCGWTGSGARTKLSGSDGIQLLLLLCFIIPGLIYWMWRRSNWLRPCPKCGNNTLVPASTPTGQAISARAADSRPTLAPSIVQPTRSAADRMRDLSQLREQGLISVDEYEDKRRSILGEV